MNKKATVYVTQQPSPNGRGWTPNLSPAAEFGTIRYVFEAAERPYTDPDWALQIAEEALKDFDSKMDFVLWPNTGDPAAAWATMLVLGKKGVSEVQTLYWERQLRNGQRSATEGFYSVVTFRLTADGNRKIVRGGDSRQGGKETWQPPTR